MLTTNAPQLRDILHHAWPHAAHQNNYIYQTALATCQAVFTMCCSLLLCAPKRAHNVFTNAPKVDMGPTVLTTHQWCSLRLQLPAVFNTQKNYMCRTVTVTLCADTAYYYYFTPWINGRVLHTKTTRETVLTTRQKVLTIGAVRSLHAPNGAPESGIFVSQDHDPSKPFFRSTFDARMLHFPARKTMMRTWMHLWNFGPSY